MSSLGCVPCLQINNQNISQCWDHLIESINESHFVAIDLELSGLGPRHKLNAKKIDERYEAVLEAAKSRSIVSIGLSLFTFIDNNINSFDNNCELTDNLNENIREESTIEPKDSIIDDKLVNNRYELLNEESEELQNDINISTENNGINISKEWKFSSKVFNMLCICEEDYVVEPESLRFLVGHGFDFNQQCMNGLPYHKGNDSECDDFTKPTLRNLISHIITKKLPIVLHNGLIDLIFLYQNFYCDLPNDLQTFIADLSELFVSGIFDTKYIADFHERLNRSYLEYLFYERQRFNIERRVKGQTYIEFSLNAFPDQFILDIELKDLSTKLFADLSGEIEICYDYANHGWCKQNHSCFKSHNIDHILDKKKNQSKRMKKIVRQLKSINSEHITGNEEQKSSLDSNECNVDRKQAKQGVHRAGYDAFMTGYCFAYYTAINSKNRPDFRKPMNFKRLGISQIVNNIYLTGKDQSLRISASSFAKTSTNHKNKILRLRNS